MQFLCWKRFFRFFLQKHTPCDLIINSISILLPPLCSHDISTHLTLPYKNYQNWWRNGLTRLNEAIRNRNFVSHRCFSLATNEMYEKAQNDDIWDTKWITTLRSLTQSCSFFHSLFVGMDLKKCVVLCNVRLRSFSTSLTLAHFLRKTKPSRNAWEGAQKPRLLLMLLKYF